MGPPLPLPFRQLPLLHPPFEPNLRLPPLPTVHLMPPSMLPQTLAPPQRGHRSLGSLERLHERPLDQVPIGEFDEGDFAQVCGRLAREEGGIGVRGAWGQVEDEFLGGEEVG